MTETKEDRKRRKAADRQKKLRDSIKQKTGRTQVGNIYAKKEHHKAVVAAANKHAVSLEGEE